MILVVVVADVKNKIARKDERSTEWTFATMYGTNEEISRTGELFQSTVVSEKKEYLYESVRYNST